MAGLLYLVLLTPACTREAAKTEPTASTASSVVSTVSAASVVSAVSAASSAPPLPSASASGSVKAKDCTTWGEHYARLLRKEGARTIDDCPKGNFTSKELDDRAKQALDKEAERSAADIAKSCVAQIGKPYVERDAACFLRAQNAAGWDTCRFESAFFVELAQKSTLTTKLWPKKCSDMKKPGDEY
jgi:hypothetical protein